LYRKIPPDKYLLRKNEIIVDKKKVTKESVNSLVILQPNTTFLGYPYLADLYMLADQHPKPLSNGLKTTRKITGF